VAVEEGITVMKILYTTASRLGGTGLSNVAHQAALASYDKGCLRQVICYGNRQTEVPDKLIKKICFQPAKIFSSLSSRYYYSMKRMWLDWRASHWLQKHDVDIFHGWTHESLNTLRIAREKGIIGIVDRGYSHPKFSKRILDEEFEIYGVPRNLDSCPTWLKPYDHWRRELEEACEEFDLADYVFVNSSFCYNTFIDEGFPKDKLVMLPRGFDARRYYTSEKKDQIFRVIFVGQMLVRKGLKYLLESWNKLSLPNSELLLVGHMMDEVRSLMAPYLRQKNIRHLGFVPDPVAAYQSASVFIFPSVDEGSAKVTYEAMACGLPVIVTANAGSLAIDGEDGFIVPIRSVDALMEKILFFFENPEAMRTMGMTGRRHIENYTWETYRSSLVERYQSVVGRGAGQTEIREEQCI
jgi:glycosyltransferase involved in cell wall biosynthesis